MQVLREELLAGRRIAVAGAVPEAVAEALVKLGAQIEALASGAPSDDDDGVGRWARARPPLDAVVCAGSADHGTEEVWAAVREVAVGALIPGGRGGKIVLIAPAPGGAEGPCPPPGGTEGPFPATGGGEGPSPAPRGASMLRGARMLRGASMLRAALENLARTLSVEWARHGLTAVMIAPGARTTPDQLAELVCFVVSDAGDYLSGCRLDMGSVA